MARDESATSDGDSSRRTDPDRVPWRVEPVAIVPLATDHTVPILRQERTERPRRFGTPTDNV